jgi:hypothetical protein
MHTLAMSSRTRRLGGLCLLVAMLLAGCSPPYVSDTYASSTPKPKTFDVAELQQTPVATLTYVAPGNLQGFGTALSHALAGALANVTPPIRQITTEATLNQIADRGLGAEYADLRAGFGRNGILDRQKLRHIGSALGVRYVLLPGLAQLDESIIDRFEAAGLKILRNRVTSLRLWLQLWDAQTGHIVWESSGEMNVATVFLSARQVVALQRIAQRLLVQMIQDGLLGSSTETQITADQ